MTISSGDVSKRTPSEPSKDESALQADAQSKSKAKPVTAELYRGNTGKHFDVSTNYLKMGITEGMGLYEYDIKFEPAVDNRNDRFRLVNQHADTLGRTKIFDGYKLYLPKEMPSKETVLKGVNPTNEQEVSLTIRFKKKCANDSREVIQHYNILFNRIFRILKFSQHRRNFYDGAAAHHIRQHAIQVWPGYVAAVDEYEGGVLLQIDISHRVLRQETVKDYIKSLGPNMTKGDVEKSLLGAAVVTRYNNKSYRIDDIDWDASPKDTFTNSRGESMTYMDYYKNNYGLTIMDPNQPLLINRPKKKSTNVETEEGQELKLCLIPETCLLTGMTDKMRADFRVMKDVAQFTRMSPEQRKSAMLNFIERVTKNEEANALLKSWGLSLAKNTMNLMARMLPPERLVFGNRYEETASPKGDWSRAATSKPVLTAVNMNKWAIFLPEKSKQAVQAFCKALQQQAPRMGIQIANPKVMMLPDDRTETYLKSIRDTIDKSVQMVLAVVPQVKSDRYAGIKKLCCIEKPVASQVVVLKNITNEKKMSSVAQKVILQMNCKLGGELWAPRNPVAKKLMVVGIDVFHDKGRRAGSIAGVVSTINDALSRFYSLVAVQSQGQELIDALQSAFIESLLKYFEVNQHWPENIVIFRDGVGDGQMEVTQTHECEQFLSAISRIKLKASGAKASAAKEKLAAMLPEDYSPGFNFVVVQKRISTRIFGLNKVNQAFENPPPGTVLDHTVTRYAFKDFFLVPQAVTQGTVTPTHYVVLRESGACLDANQVQRLSYSLTHMYYNWPGTVRVPAPCQYAHKLVDLVGEHLHKSPSPELNDRLYFL